MAQRNVNATIDSVQDTGAQAWTIMADIPSISQFPEKLSRVPEHIARQLKPGHSYDLTVKSENLKKDKSNTPYDGKKPWHFYWGLVGIGHTEGVPEISPPMPTNHVGFEDGAQMDTGVSQPKPSFDGGAPAIPSPENNRNNAIRWATDKYSVGYVLPSRIEKTTNPLEAIALGDPISFLKDAAVLYWAGQPPEYPFTDESLREWVMKLVECRGRVEAMIREVDASR